MSALRETAPAADNVTPFPFKAQGPRVVTLDLDDAQRVQDMLIRFRNEILIPGVDYGTIPHTNGATLYKPGGEKLLAFFGLGFKLEITRDEDWDKGRVSYEVKTIIHDKRTQEVITEGIGSCNSKERKYKNKDAAEVANTCLKMAKKRSLLDGVLTATGASGLFEDGDDASDDRPRQQQRNQQQRPQQQRSNQARPQQSLQRPALQPVKPRRATREELDRCERARRRAIELGYLTATGTQPKPVADGTPVNEASAKCQKWEKFIKDAESTPATTPTAAPDLNLENQSAEKPDNRQKYQIPKHMLKSPPQNCRSCGTPIYWLKGENGNIPVQKDGYNHFTTCPQADQHRKARPAATAAPVSPASAAQGKQPLTTAQKRLWAVIGATGLPQAKDGDEKADRLDMTNQALAAGGFQPVTSFNQLTDDEVAYLVEKIEAGLLFWGAPAEVTA
jgi:hypothetical protein